MILSTFAAGFTDVDGRDKPGHDEKRRHSGMTPSGRP
jgi:hypothetical protein